jgi:hypothetical protein
VDHFIGKRPEEEMNIPGDIGSSGASGSISGCWGTKLLDMEACVTVELLPLELPELLVAVVNDVSVETRDGDVKRPLAAAASRTVRWSSITSSSPEDELEDSPLGCDRVRRCLCLVLPGYSSREARCLEFEALLLTLLEFLLTSLLGVLL